MRKATELMKRFAREESGASLVEYGVLVGLVTAAVVGLVTTLGGEIATAFTNVINNFTAANNTTT